jgi:hypothetical protein
LIFVEKWKWRAGENINSKFKHIFVLVFLDFSLIMAKKK